MAEIAAGAVVAEQVVSTAIEGGAVAAYAVAKPTMPLKASLTQMSYDSSKDIPHDLTLSHHTITAIDNKLYFFGGTSSSGELAPNNVYSIDLLSNSISFTEMQSHDAQGLEHEHDSHVPVARQRHAACARGKHLVVFGGCDETESPVKEDAILWLWDSEKLKWAMVTALDAEGPSEQPSQRFDHKIFADPTHDWVIIHGGRTDSTTGLLMDTWLFDMDSRKWTQLADGPAPTTDAAYMDGTLYTITGLSEMSSEMHSLVVSSTKEQGASQNAWQTIPFPTNPLVPGPRPRDGSALLPITTGYGRQYLMYMFGCKLKTTGSGENPTETSDFFSDIWTYQLPSKSPKPSSWTDLKPAIIKDVIREKLGFDSGGHSWEEVEVQANEQIGHEGKVHPGPRGFFGATVLKDGTSVVIWGGVNAKGEKEGDGWVVKLS